MNIVIDSTEYKKDRGLNKADISLIKDMGAEDLIKLHIPYFVYKECSSSSIFDLAEDLNSLQSTLNSLERKGMGKSDCKIAKNIAEKIFELGKSVETSNKELWDNFVNESKAKLYDYESKDSIEVFDAYFTGGKPFKSLKKRDDIPDAFIYTTIKKISSLEVVNLVSGDNNLRVKCESLENVKVFSSFEELYSDLDFKIFKKQYDELKYNQKIGDAKEVLLDNEDAFMHGVLQYLDMKSHWDLFDTCFPSDNGDISVDYMELIGIEFDKLNIQFIDDRFFVPIVVYGKANISYAIHKRDYWLENDLPAICEQLDDHYYLLKDETAIQLSKKVIIELDKLNNGKKLEIKIDEFDEVHFEDYDFKDF